MFEITIVGFSIVIVFLVLLYFLSIKANNIFDEIFDMTKLQSRQFIKDFKAKSYELSNEFENVNSKSIEKIEQNSQVIKEINHHLSSILHQLKSIENHINEVNSKVLNRQELENEIVKLKNIIKRLEKRNVQ